MSSSVGIAETFTLTLKCGADLLLWYITGKVIRERPCGKRRGPYRSLRLCYFLLTKVSLSFPSPRSLDIIMSVFQMSLLNAQVRILNILYLYFGRLSMNFFKILSPKYNTGFLNDLKSMNE